MIRKTIVYRLFGSITYWMRTVQVIYPAANSLQIAGLPIGLAHNMKLKRDIAANQPISWNDVDVDETLDAIQMRRELQALIR